MENARKDRDIKPVTTKERSYYLVKEPKYHIPKCFSENLLTTEIKKTEVVMNKTIHLGLSILEISKITMYDF